MGLENYTRIKKLGKGSFGEVYLVVDKRNQTQYVMKEIDLQQFGPKGRKEALKEVGFLNAMHHPFIVGYREFFEQDATGLGRKMLYIVMEFADGGDLDGRIKAQNGRPFPEAQILEWFVQICLALKHIHDRKIIHRDLKAENIFLMKSSSSNGSNSQVKLGDFGISKSMAHTMANAITRIGTPYYLSPEICMNKPYNSKSDQWSLGVVLYEMMSLKHPFDATSMEGLLNKIVKSQPPPLPKQYSIELRTVVDSLLSKQPSKRPTVNSLLKLPFLAQYVQKLLSPAQMAEEFSHTVLHSDASARSNVAAAHHHGPPLPQSNHVAHRERPLPAPTGIKPKQQQQLPNIPTHPSQQPSARPPSQFQHHAPPQQQQQSHHPHYDQKESVSRGGHSPYYGAPPPAQPPASYRPSSARMQPHPSAAAAPASSVAPPSPYAGLSNADKIRAIREKKESELREAKRQQEELTRRRMQQQQQQQAVLRQQEEEKYSEETDRQRQREMQKERQMAAAARGMEDHLPPALRQQGGGGRGIPSVARHDVVATPLMGVPYNARDANPTRLQHAQLAEQARRQREEEQTRMRINYFKERKVKRETKLKELSHAPNNHPYAQQQQQRPMAQPTYVGVRPPSSGRAGGGENGPLVVRHGPMGGVQQQQMQRRPFLQQPVAYAGQPRQTEAPRWR